MSWYKYKVKHVPLIVPSQLVRADVNATVGIPGETTGILPGYVDDVKKLIAAFFPVRYEPETHLLWVSTDVTRLLGMQITNGNLQYESRVKITRELSQLPVPWDLATRPLSES